MIDTLPIEISDGQLSDSAISALAAFLIETSIEKAAGPKTDGRDSLHRSESNQETIGETQQGVPTNARYHDLIERSN